MIGEIEYSDKTIDMVRKEVLEEMTLENEL